MRTKTRRFKAKACSLFPLLPVQAQTSVPREIARWPLHLQLQQHRRSRCIDGAQTERAKIVRDITFQLDNPLVDVFLHDYIGSSLDPTRKKWIVVILQRLEDTGDDFAAVIGAIAAVGAGAGAEVAVLETVGTTYTVTESIPSDMIETETRDNKLLDGESKQAGVLSGERISAGVTAAEASGMTISAVTSGEPTTPGIVVKKLGTTDVAQIGAEAHTGTEVCHRAAPKSAARKCCTDSSLEMICRNTRTKSNIDPVGSIPSRLATGLATEAGTKSSTNWAGATGPPYGYARTRTLIFGGQ